MRMIADATRTTGCSAALICRQLDGEFVILAATKDGPLKGIKSTAINAEQADYFGALADRYGNPSPVASHSLAGDGAGGQFVSERTLPVNFHTDDGASVQFAAAVRIGGEGEAFLIVLHDEARAELSAAQIYVLHAQAAHLSTMFELADLRDKVDLVDMTVNRPRVERLRLLESVAIHARDSIIITEAEPFDLPGPRIIYCNAAFARATGYSAAEVIGQTPRILQGPKTDPVSKAKMRAAFEVWQPIEIELLNYRKDGTEFWVELSIVPVADDRGWYTHWVSVQRDITERKQAAELAVRMGLAEVENKALAAEIHERKRVEAALFYAAFHDELTHLRNRAFFMERLSAALERLREGQISACSVLFLDLDQFKIINDSLGHVAGDSLLKEVAQRLRDCVRPQDTLARLGGDEFAILIEDADDLKTPVRVAETIIDELRQPVQLGRQSVFPSCSIGIVHSSDPTATPDDLLRDADIAMYAAKRGDLGDYAIFDASMHDNAVARLSLQTDLRQAVDQNQFHLAYQPVVDPTNGSISGFEALLRWQHPVRGTISPDEFIPVAEELGLIGQIGRWVMRESLAQLGEWQKQFSKPDLRMSFNASATEFVAPDFIGELTKTLSDLHLEPGCVEVEITEGIFLHPLPGVESMIEAARRLGVRIALDDFGTGYSSLSYISQYAVDTIKIDKSFIDRVCTDHRTRAIVELIIRLGGTLDLKIIAEGVETREQVALLTDIGCRSVQGYYFSRPLSVLDAADVLNHQQLLPC
ncbi:MAG: putative bifunctional diguanylate cyclase/phosphodiesterase [Cypionkella sp.]